MQRNESHELEKNTDNKNKKEPIDIQPTRRCHDHQVDQKGQYPEERTSLFIEEKTQDGRESTMARKDEGNE